MLHKDSPNVNRSLSKDARDLIIGGIFATNTAQIDIKSDPNADDKDELI